MKGRGAVIAIVTFIVLATACAAFTVRIAARTIAATATEQSAQAPDIARLYLARYGSLAAAAPTIVKHVMRTGLRVLLFDDRNRTVYGPDGTRPLREMRWPAIGRPAPRPSDPERPPSAHARAAAPPRDDPFGDGHRLSPTGLILAGLIGESMHRVPIPGGAIAIFPDPEAILAVCRNIGLALLIVFIASATSLGFYVRGVRCEALRPLRETTLALQRLARRDFTPRTIVTGGETAYDELACAYNAAVEAVSAAFAERRAAEIEMQRFIADAGHELRTPLTIVMGYLNIIEGGALADPAVAGRITSGMRTEAVRMRRLIDKLIILARMETPSDVDARSNLDVVSLLARVIESLEPLTGEPIDLSGVPQAHVFASEDDLADAFTNIIENAIKYAPLSRIAVTTARSADRIVVTIADRGPGMSSDEQRNAFERFYRGERRGEVSGSGLGLAIAKRAIERSNGTIRVTGAVGVGTSFIVELPEKPIAAIRPGGHRMATHS